MFEEMNRLDTDEAKLYKALDNIEAVISHNEADLSTWLPREFDEMLIYGEKNAECSEWTRQLRATIREDSLEKIKKEGK